MEPEEPGSEELEPTLDVETSPMMEPVSVLACEVPASATPPPQYWQAHSLASAIHKEFEELQKRGDIEAMRGRFYILAHYYGRTMAILRQALLRGREPLINATLRNLVALHQPLHHMHEVAPTSVPFVLTLDREMRRKIIEDLIMETLQEATGPLDLDAITLRVNELHLLADASKNIVRKHLSNLMAKGNVQRDAAGYSRTIRAYSSINLDQSSLRALLGSRLYHEFERGGFQGLAAIASRKKAFMRFFEGFTGCGSQMADLFIAAAKELLGPPSLAPDLSPWHHADLIGSLYPRPYQRDSYAIFRGYGYQGKVIEAPTGSGKTMIGMMCIQDWLQTLSPGESILILVPTVNYEQQWVGELCYKPIGLKLTPDEIFTGTPSALEAERKRTGLSPAVLVMTYTALAQLGSPMGKGGFDQNSVEKFLQGSNIQYVILDEVHKVVEDLRSVSADVTRLLSEWLRDKSIRGLIGFSGTAAAYREKFEKLGLQLVYTLPAADLIAYGFVAPFSEFGVPFAYSDREKEIRDLLEQYKSILREFAELIGVKKLREMFAAVAMEERLILGKDLLMMYASRKDRDEALISRYTEWESGEELNLNEMPLISILQMANNFSDKTLVENAVAETPLKEREEKLGHFRQLHSRVEEIREKLKGLIYFPDITRRLNVDGFAETFDAQALRQLPNKISSKSLLQEEVRDGLATTMVGLYSSLKNFYFRVGEGRFDSIKSIIEAERSTRKVTDVIVFDGGKRILWEKGLAVPGYAGVAGLFSQMLGDRRFTPMAVLSSEMYMPWTEKNPLPVRIANFIKKEIMLGELGEALFSLVIQGLGLADAQKDNLRSSFESILTEYVQKLSTVGASRPGEFERKVLRKFRKAGDSLELRDISERLKARLSLKYHHLRKWIDTFFDYALIATRFLQARSGDLQQASGAQQKFFVVKMAQGDRKQLMYDLTARIVDSEELPVNMIIVSTWARTGWNVIQPNVLIDATATRNVTAWQQLRGRAMRAMRTWDKGCYELVMRILSSRVAGTKKSRKTSTAKTSTMEAIQPKPKLEEILDEISKALLIEAHQYALKLMVDEIQKTKEDALIAKIKKGKLSRFNQEEREQLASSLMLARNKVTHIYELVKAYGSSPQVRYDRPSREWRRTDSIAAKHAHEYSVSPMTGQYGSGEEHAPLIYTRDPRSNLPSQIRRHMTRTLKGRDPLIVRGWMAAVTSGIEEDLDIE